VMLGKARDITKDGGAIEPLVEVYYYIRKRTRVKFQERYKFSSKCVSQGIYEKSCEGKGWERTTH
jgi:hypothetical protein